MMGIIKCEGKLVDHGTQKYAQYDAAPFVNFIPKGKRNVRGFVQAEYKPSLLILAGHGHPEPDSMFGVETPNEAGTAFTSRSRYMSCDPRWQSDFDARIDAYLARTGAEVVADYRHKAAQGRYGPVREAVRAGDDH
jgi:hypothetical protein